MVQADLIAAGLAFDVHEGDLSQDDPYCLDRGDKHVEFRMQGADIALGLRAGTAGTATVLPLTYDSAAYAVKLIVEYFCASQ